MSRGLSVLIVDDERPAREKLRQFLSEEPDVGTVFEARDGEGALTVITSERPDAVFLDIKMPGRSGLDVLASLPADALPVIVFATAFDAYATRAFDLRAEDYLLKPFDRDRFRQALDRIRESLRAERNARDVERLRRALRALGSETPDRGLDRLMVEAEGRERLLATADIEYVEADRNYVVIHAPPDAYRMRGRLGDLERRLPAGTFARINRSQLVNLDRVVELVPAGHGDRTVRLRGGAALRLSRRYRERWEGWRP